MQGTGDASTVFARIGGAAAVSRLVFDLYENVLDSARLGRFFAGIDMRRLVEHQAKFIASVMGGPASYSDVELHAVHADLGIGEDDFDEMLSLMRAALSNAGLVESDVETVVTALEQRRPVIVTAKPEAVSEHRS